jgi:hypothetical protein
MMIKRQRVVVKSHAISAMDISRQFTIIPCGNMLIVLNVYESTMLTNGWNRLPRREIRSEELRRINMNLQTICSIIEEITQNGGTVTFTDKTAPDDALNRYHVDMEQGGIVASGESGTIDTALENAYDRFVTLSEGSMVNNPYC